MLEVGGQRLNGKPSVSFFAIQIDSVTTMSSPLTLIPHGLVLQGILLK